MITLLADPPCPAYAAVMEQFGRLAGRWATRITYHPPDGPPPLQADGEWEFGYALDGGR